MREHTASMPPCDHDECPPTACSRSRAAAGSVKFKVVDFPDESGYYVEAKRDTHVFARAFWIAKWDDYMERLDSGHYRKYKKPEGAVLMKMPLIKVQELLLQNTEPSR